MTHPAWLRIRSWRPGLLVSRCETPQGLLISGADNLHPWLERKPRKPRGNCYDRSSPR